MKNYIVIYPNTNPNYNSEICRAISKFQIEDKSEIINDACIFTPDGYPFLIIEDTEYDDAFHDAFSVDFSNPDGYGNNKKILNSLKLTGFLDWDKK